MNPLAGLILCGGQSSRMGEDKCFLQYHDKPQWQHLAEMLDSICPEVTVSCSLGQMFRLSQGLAMQRRPVQLLADLPEYSGHGPISGLLTGFHRYPGHSILMVGCDYPLLTPAEFQALIGARREGHDAVCYYREMEKLDEPLIAIYENSSQATIRLAFQKGDYSLQAMLGQIKTIRLTPVNPGRLQSVDTPEAFHEAKSRMTSST